MASEAAKEIKKAKTTLKKCRKQIIKENKPKPLDAKILNPSDINDWKKISSFKRINNSIKKKFRHFLTKKKQILTLEEAGKHGFPYGNVLGNYWHKFLSDKIKGKKIKKKTVEIKRNERVANLLFRKISEITLLDSDFRLHGFMYSKEKLSPEVFFWKGDADAIGWYYNKRRRQHEYVIVDWKVQRDLLEFWNKSDVYGKFLHQCLVYARLLQLHLDLKYLPAILIVPISSDNGKDIHPGLFLDYPKDCKNTINQYCWSVKQPEPLRKIKKTSKVLKNPVTNGVVDKKVYLKDLFAEDAKVKDLLEALGFKALELID